MRLMLFLVILFFEALEAAIGVVACIAFVPIYLYIVTTGCALDECSPLPVPE